MILWTLKLIGTVRRALAGRKYPHQLAWAVAFGTLLGVIPHGNLLALGVVLIVLSLKINHAMAGLTAVATTFLAVYLDPYSHQVGDYVLTHPGFRETATTAWQLPLVPWTDLNNTVVMGSFLIGVASLVPVFAVTYPMFRMLAPADDVGNEPISSPKSKPGVDSRSGVTAGSAAKAHQLVLVDQGHAIVAPPHHSGQLQKERPGEMSEEVKFVELDQSTTSSAERVTVETRIDVIRMKDHRSVGVPGASKVDEATDGQPMDEALNYLLRQLRDSQQKQRKAA